MRSEWAMHADLPEFLCPCNMSCAFAVLGSQNWTPLSLLPDKTQLPSGVSATLSTKSYSLVSMRMTPGITLETYLVAFKSLDTLASRALRQIAIALTELPHLDGLVQTARYQFAAGRRERHTVDAILVAIGTFQSFNQVSGVRIPHADALVEGSGSHQLAVRRDCHGRNAIFYAERQHILTRFNVPHANRAIAATGRNVPTIAGKVERVNVLLVAVECVPDGATLNIPYLKHCQREHSRASCLSHTRICLSSAPVARYRPSGLKHTLRM